MADNKKRILFETDGTFHGTTMQINGKQVDSKKISGFSIYGEGPATGPDGTASEPFFGFRVTLQESKGEDEVETKTIRITNSVEEGVQFLDATDGGTETPPKRLVKDQSPAERLGIKADKK